MKEAGYRYYNPSDNSYIYGTLYSCGDRAELQLATGVLGVKHDNEELTEEIYMGDTVEFLGTRFKVVFTCGAFCLATLDLSEYLNWEFIESQIYHITGCNNVPRFTRMDHIISIFEIIENFNEEPDYSPLIRIISSGGIQDE